MEASVLILVFGLYENFTRGKLTMALGIGSGAFCIVLFFVGLVLEIKR
jgi:hypothetical protein